MPPHRTALAWGAVWCGAFFFVIPVPCAAHPRVSGHARRCDPPFPLQRHPFPAASGCAPGPGGCRPFCEAGCVSNQVAVWRFCHSRFRLVAGWVYEAIGSETDNDHHVGAGSTTVPFRPRPSCSLAVLGDAGGQQESGHCVGQARENYC